MVADDGLILPLSWGAATVPAHPRSRRPVSPSPISFSPPPLPPVADEKRNSVSPGKSNDSFSEGSRPQRLVIRIPITVVKKSSTSTSSPSSDQEKHEQQQNNDRGRQIAEEKKASEEKSAIKNEKKKKKRCHFSIELTREEIDKDLMAITGKEPISRPMKRSKQVKRENHVFPGLSLSFISTLR